MARKRNVPRPLWTGSIVAAVNRLRSPARLRRSRVTRVATTSWRCSGGKSGDLHCGRPIEHAARDLGIDSESLRKRVRQAEADQRLRPDLPTSEKREEIKRLRRENFEPRRANEILKSASVFFPNELDPDRPR